jgi:hypothetical protein
MALPRLVASRNRTPSDPSASQLIAHCRSTSAYQQRAFALFRGTSCSGNPPCDGRRLLSEPSTVASVSLRRTPTTASMDCLELWNSNAHSCLPRRSKSARRTSSSSQNGASFRRTRSMYRTWPALSKNHTMKRQKNPISQPLFNPLVNWFTARNALTTTWAL